MLISFFIVGQVTPRLPAKDAEKMQLIYDLQNVKRSLTVQYSFRQKIHSPNAQLYSKTSDMKTTGKLRISSSQLLIISSSFLTAHCSLLIAHCSLLIALQWVAIVRMKMEFHHTEIASRPPCIFSTGSSLRVLSAGMMHQAHLLFQCLSHVKK